jgi:hypothetical protein
MEYLNNLLFKDLNNLSLINSVLTLNIVVCMLIGISVFSIFMIVLSNNIITFFKMEKNFPNLGK